MAHIHRAVGLGCYRRVTYCASASVATSSRVLCDSRSLHSPRASGIWPTGSDGTDINACAVNGSKNLLVTVDDLGFVKLFRFEAAAAPFCSHARLRHCKFRRFPAVGDGVQ